MKIRIIPTISLFPGWNFSINLYLNLDLPTQFSFYHGKKWIFRTLRGGCGEATIEFMAGSLILLKRLPSGHKNEKLGWLLLSPPSPSFDLSNINATANSQNEILIFSNKRNSNVSNSFYSVKVVYTISFPGIIKP